MPRQILPRRVRRSPLPMKHLLAWNGPGRGGSTGRGIIPESKRPLRRAVVVQVEMAGIEPASGRVGPRTSTSVVGRRSCPGPTTDRGVPRASRWSYAWGAAHPCGTPTLSRPSHPGRGSVWADVASLLRRPVSLPLLHQAARGRAATLVLALFGVRLFYEGDAPRLAVRDLPLPSKPFIPTIVKVPVAL